jgi:EAL domain-containing protein (putative c-di-GMP-specific phosphodiesterase class I)
MVCDLDGIQYQGTVSIGIALFQGQQQSLEELLKRADMAMYQAKANGRNAYAFFDPDMQQRISAHVALESELNQALDQDQLRLWYQPQVDTAGHCFGVEALIRWEHPERGLVPPNDFIPLAEETGQIITIGRWVMQEACTMLASWSQQVRTAQLSISVNVSAKQFAQPHFVEEVLDTIQRTGGNAAKLKIEITESLLAENLDLVAQKMNALRAKGVTFSLDDFGTGYSSLTYLKSLPLNQLKIDQSFVRNILTEQNQDAICRAVIALGKALGMGIIAEGVETESQWKWLIKEQCEAAQGYLFCRPVPVSEFMRWLATNGG